MQSISMMLNPPAKSASDSLHNQAAVLRHEIATPLHAMLLSLGELKEKLLSQSPEIQHLVNEVYDEAQHLKHLVRRERSSSSHAQEQCDLFDVLKFSSQLITRQSSADIEPCPFLVKGLWVQGSQSALSQVLINLLMNAAQALESSGRTQTPIRIKTQIHSKTIQVRIEDKGPGIAPHHLSEIFAPHYSTKKAQGGSGLGLAVCHDILSSLGADLKVKSSAGHGTQVILSLPRAKDLSLSPSFDVSPLSSQAPQTKARLRLLVIEDDASLGRILSRSLRNFGYEVEVVQGGHQACELLSADGSFAGIICDMHLGAMSGATFLDWLKAHMPHLSTRMLFLTGDRDTNARYQSTHLNKIPLLHKPVDPSELLSCIDSLVQSRSTDQFSGARHLEDAQAKSEAPCSL
jgi:CheY-like chemotaxis protein/anti-sigma regulatory factor (Ser/Thr protein kinase)